MQTIEFEPVVVERNQWKVTIKWSGEGLHGPFIQDNDEDGDVPMLRLVVEEKIAKKWLQRATSQTFLRATDDRDLIEGAAILILQRVLNQEDKDRFFYESLAYAHLHGKEVRIDLPKGSPNDD